MTPLSRLYAASIVAVGAAFCVEAAQKAIAATTWGWALWYGVLAGLDVVWVVTLAPVVWNAEI